MSLRRVRPLLAGQAPLDVRACLRKSNMTVSSVVSMCIPNVVISSPSGKHSPNSQTSVIRANVTSSRACYSITQSLLRTASSIDHCCIRAMAGRQVPLGCRLSVDMLPHEHVSAHDRQTIHSQQPHRLCKRLQSSFRVGPGTASGQPCKPCCARTWPTFFSYRDVEVRRLLTAETCC